MSILKGGFKIHPGFYLMGINVFFNIMALSMIAIPLAMTWSWSASSDDDARQ